MAYSLENLMDRMNVHVAYFIDNSGSTNNDDLYWTYVIQNVVFDPKYRYYFWNGKCSTFCDHEAAKTLILSKTGYSNTYLGPIMNRILDDKIFINKLVLLTDGLNVRGGDDIIRAVEAVGGPLWETFIGHLVGTDIDTTVIRGFMMDCKHEVHTLSDGMICESTLSGVKELIEVCKKIASDECKLLDRYADMMATIKAYRISRDIPKEVRTAIVDMQSALLKRASIEASEAYVAKSGASGHVYGTPDSVLAMGAAALSVKDNEMSKITSSLLNACDAASNYSTDYIKKAAIDRVAHEVPKVNADDADSTDANSTVANPDYFRDPKCPITNPMKLAITFKALGNPLVTDDDQKKLIGRNPLAAIAGSKQLLSMMMKLAHNVMPLEDAAGVMPCIVFGNSPSDVAGNKACIAQLIFGGNTYYGSYDQYMVIMWWIVRTVPLRSYATELRADADAFMVGFLKDTSSAKLGLDPTNTRPLTPTTLFNAFLYSMWAWTVYGSSDPAQDPLRELHGVFEIMRDAVLLAGGTLPDGIDDYVGTLRISSSLLKSLQPAKGQSGAELRNAIVYKLQGGFCEKLCLAKDDFILLDKDNGKWTDKDLVEYALVKGNIVSTQVKLGGMKLPIHADRCLVDALKLGNNFAPDEYLIDRDDVVLNPHTLRPDTDAFGNYKAGIAKDDGSPGDLGVSYYSAFVKYMLVSNGRVPGVQDFAEVAKHIRKEYARNNTLPMNFKFHYNYALGKMATAIEQRSAMGLSVAPEVLVKIIQDGWKPVDRKAMEDGSKEQEQQISVS